MLPAWWTARATVQPVLRASGIATTTDCGALRTRAALLALQVGLSVILLVVTALLSVSFVRLMNVDSDSPPIGCWPSTSRFRRLATRPFQRGSPPTIGCWRTCARCQASTASRRRQCCLWRGRGRSASSWPKATRAHARSVQQQTSASSRQNSSGLSASPVQRGRAFTDGERDQNRPAPALVSQRTALQLWPSEDALGKHFSRGEPDEKGFEVVGVVSDARTTSLEAPPPLMVYAPYWWQSRTSHRCCQEQRSIRIHSCRASATPFARSIRRSR